jgi:hypothetical protein
MGSGCQGRQVCASLMPGPTISTPAKNDATSSRELLINCPAVYSAASRLASVSSSKVAQLMTKQEPGAISRAYPAVACRAVPGPGGAAPRRG